VFLKLVSGSLVLPFKLILKSLLASILTLDRIICTDSGGSQTIAVYPVSSDLQVLNILNQTMVNSAYILVIRN
jgi:hypothetical protein